MACVVDFTELNTIDGQIRLSVTDPVSVKKRRFIEINSQAEGGRFKKSDISYTGVEMGLEASVLLGFRYYKRR